MGMKRAREQLVFAMHSKFKKIENTFAGALVDEERNWLIPRLEVGTNSIEVMGARVECRVIEITGLDGEEELEEFREVDTSELLWPEVSYDPGRAAGRSLYMVVPSGLPEMVVEKREAVVAKEIRYESLLNINAGVSAEDFGSAVHCYFAVHLNLKSREAKMAAAGSVLEKWGIKALPSEDLVATVDNFYEAIEREFTGFVFGAEVPVAARFGDSGVRGTIDLLGASEDGFCVVDHKTSDFSGGIMERRWRVIFGS